MQQHRFKKTLGLTLILSWSLLWSKTALASVNPAYDLSQWQSRFTNTQVAQLKKETSFVILRAQYGSAYLDQTFQSNLKLIQKYHIPYGVYSYSIYNSPQMASQEATHLHQLAPHALFYVNDIEENRAGINLNASTISWAQQMKKLTNRPVIIYSDLSFMSDQIGNAKNYYNAIWLASYSSQEPNPKYHYDLWQYTDQYKSLALGQNVDASVIPAGGKPLSFWVNSGKHSSSRPRKIKVTPKKPKHMYKRVQKHYKKRVQKHYKKRVQKRSTKAIPKGRPGYNPWYYSDPHIKQLQVKSPTGVSVYNKYNQQIMQCVKGNVIAVAYFRRIGKITQAITPKGNHFTANKKLVQQVKTK